MRNWFVPLALAVALACTSSLSAQQVLPAPRPMPSANPPPAPLVPMPGVTIMPGAGRPLSPLPPMPRPGYRPSGYQVWQYYGLTYQSWLRPRVIQVQGGGYYLSNGYLFPYVNVFPGHHFMPLAKE